MVIDQRTKATIEKGVEHSVQAIQKGVVSYIYDNEDLAYKSVATELRKLLIDNCQNNNILRKLKSKRSMFELCYGKCEYIHIQSFKKGGLKQDNEWRGYSPPLIHPPRTRILTNALQKESPVSLKDWLGEHICYSQEKGYSLNTKKIIKLIANQEGAHIDLNKDIRNENYRFVFSPHQLTNENINDGTLEKLLANQDPWGQFIIGAAIRLLEATNRSGNNLIAHNIAVR
ncbi:MAG: hypothetical protein OXF77_00030 [Thaumarchaeota archaeon]|nr:hypothetical protein [Nitrososphaerota archaeon]